MTLLDNILTPVGNLRGQLTAGGLIPGVPVIVGSASGNIAQLNLAANQSLMKLQCEIGSKGYTDSTVTVCKKNLLDSDKINISDMTFDYNGNLITRNAFRYDLPAGTYTINFSGVFYSYIYVIVLDQNNTYKNRYIISTNIAPYRTPSFSLSDGDYMIFYQGVSGSPLQLPANIQIELGSSPTTYEDYEGNEYNINWSDIGSISSGYFKIENSIISVYDGVEDHIIGSILINSFKGYNNIFCNTGEVQECIYIVDASELLQWVYDNIYTP